MKFNEDRDSWNPGYWEKVNNTSIDEEVQEYYESLSTEQKKGYARTMPPITHVQALEDAKDELSGDDYNKLVYCAVSYPRTFLNPDFKEFDDPGFVRGVWNGIRKELDRYICSYTKYTVQRNMEAGSVMSEKAKWFAEFSKQFDRGVNAKESNSERNRKNRSYYSNDRDDNWFKHI